MILLVALGPPVAAFFESPDPPGGSDFQLDSDRPERGVYRLWAAETFDARAEALLGILSASRCGEGCDFQVDHVSIDLELERRDTPTGSWKVTWTYIDSVLDASYFNVTEIVREEGRIVRRFGTAPPEVVEAWQTPERRHDPFFYEQGGTWTLTEEFDDAGRFLHTLVEVEMAMRSDRFLVNLMPGRVVKGAGDHLETIFGQMRTLEGHYLSPAH